MTHSSLIDIEVVLALPHQQWLKRLHVPAGSTAINAVLQAHLLPHLHLFCTDLAQDNSTLALGIFGQHISHEHPLQAGDRIEIYRPLTVDPKEARKRRHALKQLRDKSKPAVRDLKTAVPDR